MTCLSLSLLGAFHVTVDGVPANGFESNKVRALLAYLAVEADRLHSREMLATLLWPDYPDRYALANLRTALSNLRKTIGDRDSHPPHILIFNNILQFNLASEHFLDVKVFDEKIETASVGRLQQMVACYHGPFLEGFAISDSAPFEEWVVLKREQLGRQVLKALRRLADEYEMRGEYEQAQQYAWRQVELEPWFEEGHQQLMRVLALNGQRSAALAQYETCRRLLADELGVEPSKETTALYEHIREGISVQSAVTSIQLSAMDDQPLNTENWKLDTKDNPYKGLRPFGEADADNFFGRETLIQELLERLGGESEVARFLAVIGPSGSGKSSVVKAGLVPALRRGELPGSDRWFIADFMPGFHPLEELEAALLRVAVNPPESLLGQLKEDERGLLRAAKRILPADESVELVLVIDQFEEVFTLVTDEAMRAHFLESLLSAVLEPRSRLHVLITLRADFTDRPLQYVNFGNLIRQRTVFVLPLTPDELELAITAPAKNVGLLLESGLTARIVRDLGDQPGVLPLLQYALTELFDHREGRTLTLAAYHEIGGVLGALGSRAEEIYTGLDEPAQSAARQMFLRLVTLGAGVENTRRRVFRSELEGLNTKNTKDTKEDLKENLSGHSENLRGKAGLSLLGVLSNLDVVIDAFGNARLLTFDHDPISNNPTVEVAHEALLREWTRLRGWLNESHAEVRLQRTLAQAAVEWTNDHHDPDLLLRGTRLTQLDTWATETTLALTGDERAYLDASLDARRARQAAEATRQAHERALERRSRNVLRTLVGVLTVFLIIAITLSAFAFSQRNRANEQTLLSFSRELAAASASMIQVDPELSLLLALQALAEADTLEARTAIHRALPAQHLLYSLPGVTTIAYSPDGRLLATNTLDGSAKIWEASTGKDLLTLSGNSGSVYELVFSPDGRHLAGACTDGTVSLWTLDSGQIVSSWQAHDPEAKVQFFQGTLMVAFSPDGTTLATAGADGFAKLWEVASGRELMTLSGHTSAVISLTFNPDGTHLATASLDGTANIWDVNSGKLILTLKAEVIEVYGVAFSPDGTRIATANFAPVPVVIVWDSHSGEKLLTLKGHTDGVWRSVFSPDGNQLATASYDGTAKVWDARTGDLLLTLAGHRSTVMDLAFSPDGTRLATAGTDLTGKIWSLAPGKELYTLAFTRSSSGSFHPDGTRFFAVNGTDTEDASLLVWNPATQQLISTFPLTDTRTLVQMVLSPDGTYLATGGRNGAIQLWDARNGREVYRFPSHQGSVWFLAFSPDGNRLATASMDKTVKVWDVTTGQRLLTFNGHTDEAWGVAFSPDGKYLATTSKDRTALIWDSHTGEVVLTLPHQNDLFEVSFSPDGNFLAIGTRDGSATVWNIANALKGNSAPAQLLYTLSGHNGIVFQLAFSPDGTRLATASFDSTTKVWDMATGQELFTLFGHIGKILDVAFNPDGTQLMTASIDGTIRFYGLDTDELVVLAESRLTRWFTPEECLQYLHSETCPPDIR